ncbi:MAG TPA: hypothetical protein VHQ97_00440 [Solirubrobacterales bacterium]|nr:hypothetical protein [Solirubrobacterales bacterium]
MAIGATSLAPLLTALLTESVTPFGELVCFAFFCVLEAAFFALTREPPPAPLVLLFDFPLDLDRCDLFLVEPFEEDFCLVWAMVSPFPA